MWSGKTQFWNSGLAYSLEPLEPRLLLSGDAIFQAFADPAGLLSGVERPLQEYAIDWQITVSDQCQSQSSDNFDEVANSPDSASNEPSVADNALARTGNDSPISCDPAKSVVLHSASSKLSITSVELTDEFDARPLGSAPEGLLQDSRLSSADEQSSMADRLVETLKAPHGPPAQLGDAIVGEPFVFQAAADQNDLTLRPNVGNPAVFELLDSRRRTVLTSWLITDVNSVLIIGSDDSDDTLTVDLSLPCLVDCEITFLGGEGGYDSLSVIGAGYVVADYEATAGLTRNLSLG